MIERTCPLCGLAYTAHPALSRRDGTTEICPNCGTREALEDAGVDNKDADEVMKAIHASGN